jgi:FLVCR family feline leukemia virus subgroup C receptor-related protein
MFKVTEKTKVTLAFCSFFLAGYLSLGYVLCVEYTYPESEDIAAGLLNIMNNIYGIVFVLGLGKLIEIYGDLAAHIGLCSCLFVGFIMTLLTKDEQRRYRTVQRENQTVS